MIHDRLLQLANRESLPGLTWAPLDAVYPAPPFSAVPRFADLKFIVAESANFIRLPQPRLDDRLQLILEMNTQPATTANPDTSSLAVALVAMNGPTLLTQTVRYTLWSNFDPLTVAVGSNLYPTSQPFARVGLGRIDLTATPFVKLLYLMLVNPAVNAPSAGVISAYMTGETENNWFATPDAVN